MRKTKKAKNALIITLGLLIILIFFGGVLYKSITDEVFPLLWKMPLTRLHFLNYNPEFIKSQKCDPLLWKRVYIPIRLVILENCANVNGEVTKIEAESDGDYHINLKPDPEYSNLVNFFNKLLMGGNIILEPVCQHQVDDGDPAKVCLGYRSKVKLPEKGQHVKVTGSLVIDKTYGWVEIHPVSSIQILP